MIPKYKIHWGLIRLLIILILPFIFVWWVKNLNEFSLSSDINIIISQSKTGQNQIKIELNRELLKGLTTLDLPLLYKVYVENNAYISLKDKNTLKESTANIVVNNVEIPYQGTPQIISNKLLLKNGQDIDDYLENLETGLSSDILSGQNQQIEAKINGTNKYVDFYFKLSIDFMIILYIITLIALYPFFLLPLSYLWKFLLKGMPF